MKKMFLSVGTMASLLVSSISLAQGETMPIEKCAVQKKYERKASCLGTGLNNDPARDPQIYFYNQCASKIGVKQCFSYPNGKVADSSETIKPGQTKRIYECTQSTNPGVSGARRMEPKPTNYFVYDPENDSSYRYKCE